MKLLHLLTELRQSTLEEVRRMFQSGRLDHVQFWLKDQGWKEIGSGYYSKVYGNPSSDYVIKILSEGLNMREDGETRCALNWMRYSNQNWNSNPHLPRVYYVQTARVRNMEHEDTGDTAYLIVMERLQKPVNLYQGMSDEQRDAYASILSHHIVDEPDSYMPFIDAGEDEDIRDTEDRYYQQRMRQARSTYRQHLEGGDFQQLAQAFKMMSDMRARFGCRGDLHHENVMARPGTNELVITDPFEG